MTDDEKAKEARDVAEELKRVSTARVIAVLAAVTSVVIVIAFLSGGRTRALAIVPPLLALSLSTALIAGARALDGPLRLAGRRREALSSSPAAAAVLLWLVCFGAIEAAFLVVDVVDRWKDSSSACAANAVEQFEVIVTISEPSAKRTVTASGCRLREKAPDKLVPRPGNAEDADGTAVNAGGEEG